MKLNSKDYFFVGTQFLLFLLYIFNFELIAFNIPEILRVASFILGCLGGMILLLAILQLSKNLSPFPTPRSNSQLVQNGLYKFVRHPIYTGILMSFIGFAIYSESLYRLLVTMLLYILFLYKTRYEEGQLIERYPNYDVYKKKTGRFFPKF